MIEEMRLPATILRPNAFFQNDLQQKTPLMEKGTYVMPIGGVGVEMVDARDIADVAAAELVRREELPEPLPRETIEIVGPEAFTGPSIAALWSEVLARHVSYAGDDLRAAERLFRAQMPNAMAYDMALMLRDFHLHGMLGMPGAAERLTARLKRPLRTYRAFAEEAAAEWRKPLLAKVPVPPFAVEPTGDAGERCYLANRARCPSTGNARSHIRPRCSPSSSRVDYGCL